MSRAWSRSTSRTVGRLILCAVVAIGAAVGLGLFFRLVSIS